MVLFPGAGFVELVIRAGDEVGCALIEELVLAAPLVMHPGVGVQVQVVVGAADESGHRAVSVYSRGDQSQGWLLNAEGMLGWLPLRRRWICPCGRPRARRVWISRTAMRSWPSAVMPTAPRFRVWWRSGGGVGAVRRSCSPGEAGVAVDRMGMHPAVLDAVLHALGLAVEKTQASTETRLPFCWRGCRCMPAALDGCGPASRPRARMRFPWTSATPLGCRC